jgi:hypothetical protein
MYWQSNFTTIDGTLIEWGTGDHNTYGDNGVREYSPVTKTQVYVYPNNNGSRDVTQYDNLQYWYIPRIDSLVIPSRGQYSRASGTWVRTNGTSNVVGTGTNDLIRPVTGTDVNNFVNSYNAHQGWSARHDAGIAISGCNGCEKNARPWMWICVPASGLGVAPQPYVLCQRNLPALVDGAAPNMGNGRDGCCFLGDYVYWVGGNKSDTLDNVPNFFRMNIVPHLTSTSAPLQIERLPDAPAAFKMGLLRADPYTNALLCVTDQGVFAYDVSGRAWIVVTPSGYVSDYAGYPTNGYLPRGCLGDFIDTCKGQTFRRFFWRPGDGYPLWNYDPASDDRTKRRYRSIRLARR